MPADANETAERGRLRPGRRLLIAFVSADSYGMVLLLVLVTYIASVSISTDWDASLVLVLQVGTVWLALRTAQARRATRLAAAVVFAIAAIVAVLNLVVSDRTTILRVAFAFSALLYLVAPFAILRDIAIRRTVVDQETVLGAIAAYLIVGMFFAFAYKSIGAVQAEPFFGVQGDGTLSQDLFFSFVTLTTTGYGNLVPAGNPGQSLAVFEALMGQLFLVTAVAKVINAWTPKRWQAASDGGQAET